MNNLSLLWITLCKGILLSFNLFFLYIFSLALIFWDSNNTSLDCHCAFESAIKDTFIGPEIFCNNKCYHNTLSSVSSCIGWSYWQSSKYIEGSCSWHILIGIYPKILEPLWYRVFKVHFI